MASSKAARSRRLDSRYRGGMPLFCEADEVAIYIPPQALSTLSSDHALQRCRDYLDCLQAGASAAARVFDDRDASITFEQRGIWGPRPRGDVPAYGELEGEWSLRVVIIPEQHAITGLPVANKSRVEAFAQIFVAEPALVETPDAARLDRLVSGDVDVWRPVLDVLMSQTTKQPRLSPPAALVQALLGRQSIKAWCELAASIAPQVITGEHKLKQATRHFEEWLREAMTSAAISAPQDPTDAALERAYDALYHCEWEDLAAHATAAKAAARDSPDAPVEARRLVAAAHFGRLDFAAAMTAIGACVLLEAVWGRPWTPRRPARFPLDLTPVDDALYQVAWLCTRIVSTDAPEWTAALDTLEAVLPAEPAAALHLARKRPQAREVEPDVGAKAKAKKPRAKTSATPPKPKSRRR